jgi:hypothetical protein
MTPEDARRNLNAWVAASEALAAGKEYRIGSRSLTRADAAEVRRMIDYWTETANRLRGVGGPRFSRLTLLD